MDILYSGGVFHVTKQPDLPLAWAKTLCALRPPSLKALSPKPCPSRWGQLLRLAPARVRCVTPHALPPGRQL